MDLIKQSESWFVLSRPFKKDQHYDLASFKKLINDKLQRAIMLKDSELKLDIYDITVTQELFDKITKFTKENKFDYNPLFTFHGTSNVSKINSIIDHGYLLPYEQHPTKGYSLHMSNGNFYGDGVYSSTSANVAHWYSYLDKDDKVSMIMNLVFVGKLKSHSDDLYSDEWETNISGDIVVSKSNKFIFPVAILNCSLKKLPLYKRIPFKKTYEEETITMKHIYDDYYLIENDNTTETYDLIHHFLVPFSFMKRNSDVEILNNFINGLTNTNTYFYNNLAHHHKTDGKDSFKHYIRTYTKYHNMSVENYVSALDLCFDKLGTSKNVNVIYLLLNKPDNRLTIDYKKYKTSNNVIIKPIFMNNKIDFLPFYNLKFEIQNLDPFENIDNSKVTSENNLDVILHLFNEENKNIDCNKQKYCITFPNGKIGEGFIESLCELPLWDSENHNKLLYKGSFLKDIKINDKYYKTDLIIEDDLDKKVCNIVLNLLCQFRNSVFRDKGKVNRFKVRVEVFCDQFMDYLSMFSTTRLSLVKTTMIHIQRLLSDIKHFGSIEFSGKWFTKLKTMKFSKQLIKRAKHELDKKSIEGIIGKKINDLSDALLFCDYEGLGIRAEYREISTIEPWHLTISNVTKDNVKCSQMFINSELNEKIRDSNKKIINGCLLTNKFDDLAKMYYSYLFTQNLYFYLPSQPISLLVNTTVYLIEGFLLTVIKNGLVDKTKMDIVYKLMDNIKDYVRRNSLFEEHKKLLLSDLDNLEEYLTEKYDIQSLNKVFALFANDYEIVHSSYYSRFCFAVLAESAMRNARCVLKKSGKAENEHIKNILQMNDLKDVDTYVFDINKAVAKTTKFFKYKHTNSSPFAVVSFLEFLEYYHRGVTKEEMCDLYENKTISMRSFLKKHLIGAKGKDTQVALFLMGIKYNKASLRKGLIFENPTELINEMISEQLEVIKKQNERISKRESMLNYKLELRMMEAQYYRGYHYMPTIFNHKTVHKVNMTRGSDDKLEINESRLPELHCAYPTCPMYLHKFENRNQLMKHLSYNHLIGNYLPAFHKMAKLYENEPLESFKHKMIAHYKKDKRFESIEDFDNKLEYVWKQIQELKKMHMSDLSINS